MKVLKNIIAVILFAVVLIACENKDHKTSFNQKVTTQEALHEHSNEFNKEVVKVTESVYVAIGFGLANSILVEGKDSIFIIDCVETTETGKEVMAAYREITNKPLKAIIYTHNHADHVFGAPGIIGDDKVDVYAHELTSSYFDRILNVMRPIIEKRSYRMFGVYLDDVGLVNCGIGPFLNINRSSSVGIVRPTITFKDSLKTTIAGINVELFHAPGETNDQLFVWLPDQQVLLPGDNIYKTFPNLYTIRGTSYRDPKVWVASLDKIRAKRAMYLVPSHTQPIVGENEIYNTLTTYRDGIQYVYDQTIRHINKGLTPNEIIQKIHLPETLQNHPYLQEFYGTVEWSIKSIFEGNLGFFDGNPATLMPLSPTNKAINIVNLAGGYQPLLEQSQSAFKNGQYQWALELTDYLLRINPVNEVAIDIRYNSLIKLGEASTNPNARHYYLSSALELKGTEMEALISPDLNTIHNIPMRSMFENLSVNLVPQKCVGVKRSANFYFTDTNEKWSVQIRNGIAEAHAYHIEDPDIEIYTKSTVWKELLSKHRQGWTTILKGEIKVEPGIGDFKEFMDYFKED